MIKIAVAILTVIAVSGCTMPGSFQGMFGMGDVNTTELSPDLLVIQNINVIPSPPINAGDMFTVSFEINNQDDLNDVEMGYKLYDYGLCKAPDVSKTQTSDNPSTNLINTVTLAPHQVEFKEWTFTAPGNGEIGGLSTTCPVKFIVVYEFDAKSQIDVEVISSERLYEMQRAGQSASFTPSLTVGRGPVKVYFSFGTSLPVRNSSVLPMFITVEDKGNGILRSIGANSLSLSIPKEFSVNCNGFNQSSSDGANNIYKNSQAIPMIKKNSPQMRCELTSPNSASINDLEKTFFISASLSYTYEITGETTVGIKPVLT